jgi:hypothetical protein
MKILFNMTFAIVFLVLQICNLVLAGIRFDKSKMVGSILEILIPVCGACFNILLGFT